MADERRVQRGFNHSPAKQALLVFCRPGTGRLAVLVIDGKQGAAIIVLAIAAVAIGNLFSTDDGLYRNHQSLAAHRHWAVIDALVLTLNRFCECKPRPCNQPRHDSSSWVDKEFAVVRYGSFVTSPIGAGKARHAVVKCGPHARN